MSAYCVVLTDVEYVEIYNAALKLAFPAFRPDAEKTARLLVEKLMKIPGADPKALEFRFKAVV